ncbi:expansin-like B1 [Dioscorea cayenensis subsp. rotundata]|uniref:Expansin-like B1 n=1 Tax=Dioscorea cayennensis subsp. rotundata TaxID=55577 RepID=A0AB40D0T4_DIOCR|nr:expansin-like B1 [Dioscorea cayenensis subsp. rotundata]
MALLTELIFLVFLFLPLFLCRSPVRADTFTHSRAAYYPNSDQQGTSDGACGYKSFGATLNGGDVSAASNLYRNGVGCGACYQVICTDSSLCSTDGVRIVITDSGSSSDTDFILSQKAFSKMGQTADAGASLLSLGAVDIEYQRIPCSWPGKNITFKVDEASDFPGYLAFLLEYQQGDKDITAVRLCETENLTCKLIDRSHGAMWAVNSPPSGPLSIQMLLSGGDDGDETWVVATNNVPESWKTGESYDLGIQLN